MISTAFPSALWKHIRAFIQLVNWFQLAPVRSTILRSPASLRELWLASQPALRSRRVTDAREQVAEPIFWTKASTSKGKSGVDFPAITLS